MDEDRAPFAVPQGNPGRSGENNRGFANAVIWIAMTGAPWRDLPERFGEWNSVFQRFNRWCTRGVWLRVHEVRKGDLDLEHLPLGSTIVRIKHYRRVATRYEKTGTNYLGFLCLAALLTTII